MRGIGVLEDGFVFTEAELERGAPRFWWGLRKRAAYDRALARRGMGRKDREDDDASDSGDRDRSASGSVAAAAVLVSEATEKKTEGGGSWFGSWGGDGSDGGGSSDSGGSGGDGGSSGE